jgi:hypothetical protein
LVPDEEGQPLSGLSEARHEALLAAREIVSEAIRSGELRVPEAFVIADEADRTLEVLPLTTVLPEQFKK